ncbi:hypothetical protein [Nocardia seriolae]|uniref:Uncharacterized protein n=1 Tax=Nocardia seriolae TaxID=37332 RepID=A0A0B8NGE0_9NOCA|nr:hypothetical protein [Nocardia seriolae]APA97842.1 hypothetical protein NS506_03793 [Nocardia seriolae]MTJ67031.1 hypothetical protein [Nocardia seriolae]MTJ76577.1 hypothetical protein [Nocardia seriolae]MTJ87601.1 hypothetical protein [Nocardia seriolae]MTK31594.1 hypothetical protein [Nocardia seriolae]
MTLYTLNPDVPADHAEWVVDDTADPPQVTGARFEFVLPVISELLTSQSGLYAVTEPLAAALAASGMTGFSLVPAEGAPADYADNADAIVIPTFYGLYLHGEPGKDDFAHERGAPVGLVLSQRAADLLCERDPALSEMRWEVDETGRLTRDPL